MLINIHPEYKLSEPEPIKLKTIKHPFFSPVFFNYCNVTYCKHQFPSQITQNRKTNLNGSQVMTIDIADDTILSEQLYMTCDGGAAHEASLVLLPFDESSHHIAWHQRPVGQVNLYQTERGSSDRQLHPVNVPYKGERGRDLET